MSRIEKPLSDGQYLATCRDKSLLAAVSNGHSSVWPSARMVIKGGDAEFFKDGKSVWSCNAGYAGAHFDLVVLPTGWFTDQMNRAGTAHFFRIEETVATSLCGRVVEADSLQPMSEALKQCSRCTKAKERA